MENIQDSCYSYTSYLRTKNIVETCICSDPRFCSALVWKRECSGAALPVMVRCQWLPASVVISINCGHKARWTELFMLFVAGSDLSDWHAALQYNVPCWTLGERMTVCVQPGAVSGAPKYISSSEEGELARFLYRCGFIGYARSKQKCWPWCSVPWRVEALVRKWHMEGGILFSSGILSLSCILLL